MQYRTDRYGNRLSILGFGGLRFPKTRRGQIDLEETEREILAAIRGGVNYIDTAYIYSGSEAVLGQILARNNVRDQVYLADKLPHYLIRSREGLEKYFSEQLTRLKTDRIDYYLIHLLNDVKTWDRLRALGIEDWLKEKQKCGAIGQVGFSYHGSTEPFCKLLDAWDWDFCQIQYNYLDRHTQAGERGLHYAAEKGIPVIIMEPLRGGKLVNLLPEPAKKILDAAPKKRTPAQWAFLWLWSQPQVTCVLSGMNSMSMLEENLRTAEQAEVGIISPEEDAMLQQVVAAIQADLKVGCTACGYCMPCPRNVDIPGTFACYNRIATDGKSAALKEYLRCTAMRKIPASASQCIGCGKCE